MVIYTSKINEKLKNTDDFLLSSENKILNQIDECAKRILPLQDTRPIILISGPSGSSKTTTAINFITPTRQYRINNIIKIRNAIVNKNFIKLNKQPIISPLI